jgi:uncharacterized membrane protein (DUF106 family)
MTDDIDFRLRDKLAFGGAGTLILAYTLEGVRETLGAAFNSGFRVLGDPLPFYAVLIVFAVLTAYVSTTIRGLMTDPESLAAAHEEMAELQQKIGPGVDEAETLSTSEKTLVQQQAMAAQLTILKMQFRPLGWIMLVSLPVFLWLSWKVSFATGAATIDPTVVFPVVGETTWATPVVWAFQTWIVVYILLSTVFAQLFLKTIGWNTREDSEEDELSPPPL